MKKGFTLMEVLITLGIIGIISVLTVPNLIANYQRKVLLTQLEKTYGLVRTAVIASMQDELVSSYYDLSWFHNRNAKIKFFEDYFNTVSTCTSATGYAKCLGSTYYSYDKSKTFNLINNLSNKDELNWGKDEIVCAILETGATVCVGQDKYIMDVNGKKDPNIIGKDVFGMMVTGAGKPRLLVPRASGGEETAENCFTNGTSVMESQCMLYVVENGWELK